MKKREMSLMLFSIKEDVSYKGDVIQKGLQQLEKHGNEYWFKKVGEQQVYLKTKINDDILDIIL